MWDTSCVDWADKLRRRECPIPALPLFEAEAEKALRIFKRLRCPDIEGNPTYGQICDEWVFEIVRAIFGSYDAEAKRRMIREFFVLIPKKNGKALALDTEIATPTGFTTMGSVRVGDLIIDSDGKPTRVVAKSPVYLDHECFEVEFSTGERVVCDAGHLWVTDAHTDRDRMRGSVASGDRRAKPQPSAKTTEEIAKRVRVKIGESYLANHGVALCGALDLPGRDFAISPYTLGVWLGDGTSAGGTVTVSSDDAQEMLQHIVESGEPAFLRGKTIRSKTIALSPGRGGGNNKGRFVSRARALGVIGNKFIPQEYLRGSFQQRLSLLQGLMDTDGTISKAGQATFTTTSRSLRNGVLELLSSLGLKSSSSEGRARFKGKDCGPVWDVQFWPFDKFPVFRMARKLERQCASRRRMKIARSSFRKIVAVRSVPRVPVQCLQVESETKQFAVTRSLIPTHNSSISAAIIVTATIINRRPEAECLLIAPTKQIANIAFKQAAGIIRLDPALAALFHLQQHLRTITHRTSLAQIIIKAADTDAITGGKATFTLIDETHVFASVGRAADVFIEVRGALASRPDGFLLQITTQSKAPPVGVFKAELEAAREVRDGKVQRPVLAILYEYPDEIQKSGAWKLAENWDIVNPNLGRSVDKAFLADELAKAERAGAETLALFASQHFNIEIGMALRSTRWEGADFWLDQADEKLSDLETLLDRSDLVVVGIDGGGLEDLLGLAIMGRDQLSRDWLLWTHAWAHKKLLERHTQIAPALLDFQRAGSLSIYDTPGDDVEELVSIIQMVEDSGKMPEKGAIGVDVIGITEIVDGLEHAGLLSNADRVVGIGQGWKLANTIKTTARRLAAGTLWHSGSGLMTWSVGHAIVEPRGNAILITKATAGAGKIDPLMATFNAVTLMAKNPEGQGRSFWDRGTGASPGEHN